MRLIDADAIEYSRHLEPFGNGQYEYVNIAYEHWIDNVPTVDAVPVIRCKDCAKRTFTKCPMAISRQSDYDFCSRAERKKEKTGHNTIH